MNLDQEILVRSRPFRHVIHLVGLAGAVTLAAIGLMAAPAHAAQPSIPAGTILILDNNGAPVEGAVVSLIPLSDPFVEYYGATDADGTLDLTTVRGFDPSANPYYVWIYSNGYFGYWDLEPEIEVTTPLAIVPGGPTVVSDTPTWNAPPDATSAGIAGNVTDALTGEPLLGTLVAATGIGTNGAGNSQTKLDGSYYLSYVEGALPTTATVEFTNYLISDAAPYGYAPQTYDGSNQGTTRPTTPVPVNADEITTGIDAQLMPYGQISGVVTVAAENGITPAPDVGVTFWDVETKFPAGGTNTGPDGSFSMPLIPGNYIIEFTNTDEGNSPTTLYYNGAATYDAATPVPVTARENIQADAQFGTISPPTPTPTDTAVPALAESGAEDWSPLAAGALIAIVAGLAALVAHRHRSAQRQV